MPLAGGANPVHGSRPAMPLAGETAELAAIRPVVLSAPVSGSACTVTHRIRVPAA